MSTSAQALSTSRSGLSILRSPGIKLFLILGLALAMSLPALYVDGLVDQRAASHATATSADGRQGGTLFRVHLADSYRSVTRSLKYITLFLGLVFLTYFLFEVTTRKNLHPGQYALVGVAQVIFYLLLLSLSEIVGFDVAFLVAGGATVLLLSWNAGWVLGTATQRWRALGIFSALYAFIYVLLRLENYALLVGAVASFATVAAAMYLTRHIDWFDGQPALRVPARSGEAGTQRESWLE